MHGPINRSIGHQQLGESVRGVQLSITLTNSSDVISVGSPITFVAVVKNLSTNIIDLEYTALPSDYDAVLTSATGKTYHIIDPPLVLRLHYVSSINPGEQNVRILSASVNKNIEAGNYALQAIRPFCFDVDKQWLKAKSNLIKIQVQ
ncbi:MAG TPA: hypothetical protein VK742_04190 [Candidatus Sulfotelmatobacter sp.]|nr:hypothetical protein [Candidatus Sulfotelmatobacter sp.]